MTSLITDKHRTVELFIENLLWGRVKAEFFKYFEHRPENEAQEYIEDMYVAISRWRRHKAGEDSDFIDEDDFNRETEKLYDAYIDARIDGMITGELIDEKHEATVRKLKREIEALQIKNKELEEEKVRLTTENITLANELKDRQHIIDSYEKASGYKKDD